MDAIPLESRGRTPTVLKNYLLIALRNVRKFPLHTILNVGGLALGIAAAFVLSLYVRQELTYDRHFEDHERIYRVATDFFGMGGFAKSQQQLLDHLPEAVPQVEVATRFDRGFQPTTVVVGDRAFEESHYFFVDSTYFQLFSYSFILGDPAAAMAAPDAAVISRQFAERYFGSPRAAFGDVILVGRDKTPYRISGVVEDPPGHTHLRAGLFLPLTLVEPQTHWTNVYYYNYVKMRPGSSRADLERSLDLLLREYAYPASGAAESFEAWLAGPQAVKFWVQPLSDIYLHSDFGMEIVPGGNPTQVYVLGVIGLFILLIAGVNYVNLTTAQSSIRAKEVGVKKTLGAGRRNLMRQFLVEAVVVSTLAMLVGAGLADLMLRGFAYATDSTMMKSVFVGGADLLYLAVFAIVVGLLAGIYPAFYLSGLGPARALKSGGTAPSGGGLRSALVVAQFTIATGLGICSFIIHGQLSFMRASDKGFEHEGVLVVENADALGDRAAAFRRELEARPQVRSSSFASRTPTATGIVVRTYQTPEMDEAITIQTFPGDEDYIPTLGMRLIAGRNFSGDLASDSSAAILNESAVRALSLIGNPIGQEINDGQTVIGVVSDFHFHSFRQKIEPVVLTYASGGSELVLKLGASKANEFVAYLEEAWSRFAPDEAIQYAFLDDNFARLAEQERMLSRAVSFFTVLALLIACIGLFGLTAFAMQRRTKEIGIRKVLGATIAGLVVLLSRDMARLVLVAFVLAAPIAYLLMSRWLDDFAYRIDLGLTPFVIGGAAALGIALLTVSYQAIRAAAADPVKSLRYE